MAIVTLKAGEPDRPIPLGREPEIVVFTAGVPRTVADEEAPRFAADAAFEVDTAEEDPPKKRGKGD